MPSAFDRFVAAMWPEYQALTERVNQLMGTQAQFDERMGKIDAATTEIANDLQKLRDDLKASGSISDSNLAILDAKIARLVVLGADPENPAPEV